MAKRLEPKPCCGQVPEVEARCDAEWRMVHGRDAWWVVCYWCGRRTKGYSRRYRAVKAWNRRAPVVQEGNTP